MHVISLGDVRGVLPDAPDSALVLTTSYNGPCILWRASTGLEELHREDSGTGHDTPGLFWFDQSAGTVYFRHRYEAASQWGFREENDGGEGYSVTTLAAGLRGGETRMNCYGGRLACRDWLEADDNPLGLFRHPTGNPDWDHKDWDADGLPDSVKGRRVRHWAWTALPAPDGTALAVCGSATDDGLEQIVFSARYDPGEHPKKPPACYHGVDWTSPTGRRSYDTPYPPISTVRFDACTEGIVARTRSEGLLVPFDPHAEPVHLRWSPNHTFLEYARGRLVLDVTRSGLLTFYRPAEKSSRRTLDLGRPVQGARTAPDGLSLWAWTDRDLVRIDLDD